MTDRRFDEIHTFKTFNYVEFCGLFPDKYIYNVDYQRVADAIKKLIKKTR